MSLFKKSLIRKNYQYKLLEDGISKEDILKAKNVLDSKQITMASKTRKFEEIFAKKMGVKYALMVNSGSSANLLAIFAAGNPLRQNRLKPGDEVIIPVLCWSTSLWPLVQFGLKPVFIDIDPKTLNVNEDELIKKITPKTKCIFLINVHGNSCNLFKVKRIATKKKIILIEDSCESLGSKLKDKYLGTFGDFGTFSFFYSHQITSGEGGMIVCHNDKDYEILFALRSHGWLGGTRFYTRRLKSYNHYAKKYPSLDPRYIFVNSGFNLRPTDIQAAIGMSQLERLEKFKRVRIENRKKIIQSLKKNSKWNNQFQFIDVPKKVSPSYMVLPIMLNSKFKKKKIEFINYIESKGLQTRPIISGNFTNQPSSKLYKLNYSKKKFPGSDKVQNLGFVIGLHTKKISITEIKFITKVLLSIDNF